MTGVQTCALPIFRPDLAAKNDPNNPQTKALNTIDSSVRGNEVGSAAGYGVRTLPAGYVKEDANWATAIRIWNAVLAIDKQAADHQASEKTIKDLAGSNHNFLELFRSGNAKTAVKFFPAEYNYLSTVSAQTKSTAMYVSGLKQDITALQNAEVNATSAQKIKLAADIVTLQNLIKLTTAAVYSVGLTPAQLTTLQNTKDQGSSNPHKTPVTTRDINTQHVIKGRGGPDRSTVGVA